MAPYRRNVFIRVGHEHSVRVTLGRPGAHRPFWIPLLGAVGGLGLVGGIGAGVAAIESHSSFYQNPDRATLERTNTLNIVADVTFVAGALFLAGGLTAFFLTPDPSVSRATAGDEVFREPTR
jgi:hypothetical protein